MTGVTSEHGRRMLSYLPGYYETSRVMHALLQTEGEEMDALNVTLQETLDQMFVRSATWGLDAWERELGLPSAPQLALSERRDRLVSRIRGVGTATIAVIQEVAESYTNGAVEAIEDHASYVVTIRFVDTRGVPSNLDDLQEAVRAVLPAHLGLDYKFRYFLWSDLDGKQWTWDTIDQLQLTWNELEVYR